MTKSLTRFEAWYVKPDGLSKGKGVFRVSRYGDSIYVKHRGKKGNELSIIGDLQELDIYLEPYKAGGGGYLVQQEIPLANYRGYPFDLRVLCQKDIEGKWVIAGTVVRLAALGSVITSPRSGGAVAAWSIVLQEVFKDNQRQIIKELNRIAMEICCTIEGHYGCYGELDLDMAVEANGRLWLIEVNGKPLKVSLKKLHNEAINRRIYANPIKYVCYLAVTCRS